MVMRNSDEGRSLAFPRHSLRTLSAGSYILVDISRSMPHSEWVDLGPCLDPPRQIQIPSPTTSHV